MPEPGIEPLNDSVAEAFWLEVDERHDPNPMALITCRVCGVQHLIWPDENDNPLTLAAIIDLAQGHRCNGGDPSLHRCSTCDGSGLDSATTNLPGFQEQPCLECGGSGTVSDDSNDDLVSMLARTEPIDVATYVALLTHLNAAHRAVTDHVVDGALPPRLDRVLRAINTAIERTQQAAIESLRA